MEFYRATSVGRALIESLNTMIESEDITPEVALEILNNFEQVFLTNYSHEISKKSIPAITIEGTISNYNNYYSLWRFDIENAKLKTMGKEEMISNCRIICNKNEKR